MIELVVFDMAGTTVDEDNVVYKTLHKAINHYGCKVSLEEVLAEGAGKEKLNAVEDILKKYGGEADAARAETIHQHFLFELNEAYKNLAVRPVKGAEALFQWLKEQGIRVVLNTGYNRETATGLLDKLGWRKGEEVDEVITASEVEKSRPSPDMILLAMERLQLHDAAKVAKVGDSTIDIVEGRNGGCGLLIGITGGAHTREQLQEANPDYVIDQLEELKTILSQQEAV